MTRFTAEQRFFLYEKREKNISYLQIDIEFRQRFNILPPTDRNIRKIHKKVNREFTAHDLRRGRSGSKRTQRIDENYMRLMGDVVATPKIGMRQRVPSLGLSISTAQRMMKEMEQKPTTYLEDTNCWPQTTRIGVDWATDFIAKQTADQYYEDSIWWTDEAHCHLNG